MSAVGKPKKWRRRLKWLAIALLVVVAISAFFVKDYVRTLASLRPVPGTHAYVMDYYVDYHIDEIRTAGMDVRNVENSFIKTLFPDCVVPIAQRAKRAFIPEEVKTLDTPAHHCSTLAMQSQAGEVFFGRNFDWNHDACLVLRTHDHEGVSSVSVLDLAYLNLDRQDLEHTTLIERIPLLFAPYYLMDGMNRDGVAISDMSASAEPPVDPSKPDIIHSTLMRLVLDRAKTADEAVELVRNFNVHFVDARVHLMVADRAGEFRVIEFIDGETVITSSDVPWQVCTNHLLADRSETENDEVCPRYRIGTEGVEHLAGAVTFADARRLTHSLSNSATMWSSIYDLTSGNICVLYRGDPKSEYLDAIGRRDAGLREKLPSSSGTSGP